MPLSEERFFLSLNLNLKQLVNSLSLPVIFLLVLKCINLSSRFSYQFCRRYLLRKYNVHANANPLKSVKTSIKRTCCKKSHVCLCWSGCCTLPTRRRDPTTACRGRFELLGFPPGPVRTSLVNLVFQTSVRPTILTPGLARTPVQHVTGRSRTPVLKPSSDSSLPVAWITGPATDPSWMRWLQSPYLTYLTRKI